MGGGEAPASFHWNNREIKSIDVANPAKSLPLPASLLPSDGNLTVAQSMINR